MALTQKEVAETCQRIEHGVAAFETDVANVAELHVALGLLQWLRGQYRENRPLLEGYLTRLKELRERLMGAIRRSHEELAAEYIKAGRAASTWRQRQVACRNLLAELAMLDDLDAIDCPKGRIEVQHTKRLRLPPTGTPERDELVSLLNDSGRWEDVAAISAVRLVKAMDVGRFSPDQVGRIARLCPIRPTCRLVARRAER